MTLEVIGAIAAMATLVLGPAGAAWVDVRRQVQAVGVRIDGRIDAMIKEWEAERDFTRDWMKTMTEQHVENTKEIAFLMGKAESGGE